MPPAQSRNIITQSVSDVDAQFYDSMFLMRLIQEVQPDDKSTSSVRPERTRPSSWHQFLDSLCALCHFGTGADTVCAIAVEEAASRPKLWMATNAKDPSKQKRHLEKLLNIMYRRTDSSGSTVAVSDALFSESVVFCDERVRNYSRQLNRHLKVIENEMGDKAKESGKFPCNIGS